MSGSGCSPDNSLGRQAVTGNISIDGAPLDQGSILFSPDQPGGVSSGAEIVDGQYAIPAHQGLTPGEYTVRIYATDATAEAVEPTLPGPGIKTQPERIPSQYNIRSKLKLTVAESDKAATFDLDIESK